MSYRALIAALALALACVPGSLAQSPGGSEQEAQEAPAIVEGGQGVAVDAPLPENYGSQPALTENAPSTSRAPPASPIEDKIETEPACGPRCLVD